MGALRKTGFSNSELGLTDFSGSEGRSGQNADGSRRISNSAVAGLQLSYVEKTRSGENEDKEKNSPFC